MMNQVRAMFSFFASRSSAVALERLEKAQKEMEVAQRELDNARALVFSCACDLEAHIADEKSFPSLSADAYRKQVSKALSEIRTYKKAL